MGLAPTGVWRVPPIPHCNWRTLPSSQFPPCPLLPLSPHPPLALFARFWEGAVQAGWGGGVLERRAVEGGGGSKRHLGPDPHLGVLELLPYFFFFGVLGAVVAQEQHNSYEPCSGASVRSGCPQLPYKESVSVHPVHGNP